MRSPDSVLSTSVAAAIKQSAMIAEAMGITIDDLNSNERQRVFDGISERPIRGRNRGRLPYLEIEVEGKEMNHETVDTCELIQTLVVRCHVGGRDPGLIGEQTEQICLACAAAIRNMASGLADLGNDRLGNYVRGAWSYHRDISFSVVQTLDRTTYDLAGG